MAKIYIEINVKFHLLKFGPLKFVEIFEDINLLIIINSFIKFKVLLCPKKVSMFYVIIKMHCHWPSE